MDGDRNLFDRRALAKLVRANASTTAPLLLTRILESRRDVARGLPQLDDVTLVVCDGLA